MLRTLAPGAQNLLAALDGDPKSDRYVDTSKVIRNLTMEEWQRILIVFQEWPFAPDVSVTST